MDQIVKASIDARKNVMINAYEIKDKSIIDKIEELFKKINELGGSCSLFLPFKCLCFNI